MSSLHGSSSIFNSYRVSFSTVCGDRLISRFFSCCFYIYYCFSSTSNEIIQLCQMICIYSKYFIIIKSFLFSYFIVFYKLQQEVSTMSASQDKVQSILQTVLEDSLPLVHKGIFTQQQLQNAMCQREKHQNNMLKPTFKLSDYLKAIEFQYALERQRRSRIHSLAPTNPLFKKQAKTDFVIIKRIIKLWDRTMHKFKYDLDLWKQYLQFCIVSQSKKQFYKALSFAIRFLPFSEDLWMIGVNYQIQVGLNLWKARKLFMKALRMNGKKVNLWVQMFRFQINFLKTIHERQKAIQGNQKMYFIHQKNEHNLQEDESQKNQKMFDKQDDEHVKKYKEINLEQHDDILLMVYEQAVSKIEDEKNIQELISRVEEVLINNIRDERDKTIVAILKRAYKRIEEANKKHKKQHGSLKTEPVPAKNQLLIPSTQNLQQKVQYHNQYLSQNKMISTIELDKIVSQFLTKPVHLTQILTHFAKVNKSRAVQYLINSNKFKIQHLPGKVIQSVIESIDSEQQIKKYEKTISDIIRKINPNTYIQYLPLMQTVIKFNKKIRNFKANTDIHRSVTILCKNHPQIIERCLHWIHLKNDQ